MELNLPETGIKTPSEIKGKTTPQLKILPHLSIHKPRNNVTYNSIVQNLITLTMNKHL